MTDAQPFEKKAINAVVNELERQAAEDPEKISVRRTGETGTVNGEIDVDALVMVVVGSWPVVRKTIIASG